MSYKRVKDETNLKAKYKLRAGKKNYFHVFLWKDQESFKKNTMGNDVGNIVGCANLSPTIIEFTDKGEREIVRPKLGEVHFISGKWDTEIVAHELCHALIHRLRMIAPKAGDVVEQKDDSEETICYEFGRWVDEVYRLLWKHDTPIPTLGKLI